MKHVISLLVVLFIIGSCTPPIVFDSAYPKDSKDLSELPSNYQGAFICESDSSLIIIKAHSIVIRKEYYFKMPLKHAEEKENCMISGDKMYVDGREECIPIVMENDSIVRGTVIENDTLFVMLPGSVARLHKGHVVISQEVENGLWAVSLLSLQDNSDIVYKSITDKTKIHNAEKISPLQKLPSTKRDDPKYLVKPTLGEFDDMIEDKSVFIECDYLTRVNLEQEYLFIN